MLPPEGLKLPPEVTARDVLMPKLELVLTVPAIVSVPNVSVPPLETDEPLFMVILPDGEKTPEVLTVSVPLMPKFDDDVIVAPEATATSEKFNVPELTIDAPLFNVTAPPGLLNVPVTVNAPFTVGLEEPVTVPLIFRSA